MKKKIKDLTITECVKICDKNPYCNKCPLHNSYKCAYSHNKDEMEVEVDESENI